MAMAPYDTNKNKKPKKMSAVEEGILNYHKNNVTNKLRKELNKIVVHNTINTAKKKSVKLEKDVNTRFFNRQVNKTNKEIQFKKKKSKELGCTDNLVSKIDNVSSKVKESEMNLEEFVANKVTIKRKKHKKSKENLLLDNLNSKVKHDSYVVKQESHLKEYVDEPANKITVKRKKNKMSKENGLLDNFNIKVEHDSNDVKQESNVKEYVHRTAKTIGIKKNKHKEFKKDFISDNSGVKVENYSSAVKKESNWEEFVHESAKSRLHEIKTKPYKPGNLTDLLQIKTFGRLILPFDPSFGSDSNYKIPEWDDPNAPKIKINHNLFKKRSQFGDGQGYKVSVGNLPGSTTRKDIRKLFRSCGHCVFIKLKKANDNKKSGMKIENFQLESYALIQFANEAESEAALKKNGTMYEGRHLRVTLANEELTKDRDKAVFVGNIDFNAEDEDLWKAFKHCGEIETVRIVKDIRTGRGKGFGFVNFKSSDSVAAALQLNGSTVLGREIRVTQHQSTAHSLSNSEHVKRRNKKKRKPKPAVVDSTNLNVTENKLKRKPQNCTGSEDDVPTPKKLSGSTANSENIKHTLKKTRKHKPKTEYSTQLIKTENKLKRKLQNSTVNEDETSSPKKRKKKKSKG